MDAAICAIPNDVTIAMMRGFHARCGESLGNPCLGFVCTKMTSNGDPGLEGYFIEEAAALAPEERLRFQPDECPPPFDPAQLPVIGWDEERNAKARRNYSLNYIRQMLPAMRAVTGDGFGSDISRRAARLVGLQLFAETSQMLGGVESGRPGFAAYLAAMLEGCGDEVMVENEPQQTVITQSGWRMMRGSKRGTFADFTAWAELWRGACAAHDAHLSLRVTQVDASDEEPARAQYRWVLTG